MSVEHFKNDKVEGIITHINGDGKHTKITAAQFANRTSLCIAFMNGAPDEAALTNDDGTERLSNPVYLHLHTVTECKFLINLLAETANALEGKAVVKVDKGRKRKGGRNGKE